MSFHEPGSDLSRLNRDAAARPTPVDRRTLEVLQLCDRLWRDSGGLFDPTIAPALVAAGFLPAPAGGHEPDPEADWSDVELIPSGAVRFHRPLWLDLGGIAKGYAVDQATHAVARHAAGSQMVINAGGDLRVSGPRPERVLLRTARAGETAPILELENGSLATSTGRDHQRWTGKRLEGPHRNTRSGGTIGRRSFVSVAAEQCAFADGLTKIVLAKRDRSAAMLRRYGATAYYQGGRGEWRIFGKTD